MFYVCTYLFICFCLPAKKETISTVFAATAFEFSWIESDCGLKYRIEQKGFFIF